MHDVATIMSLVNSNKLRKVWMKIIISALKNCFFNKTTKMIPSIEAKLNKTKAQTNIVNHSDLAYSLVGEWDPAS